MKLHKYTHGFAYKDSLNIHELLFFCIIMLQKCSQQIGHLDAFWNKYKDIFLLFMDFMVEDSHRKNYSIFYYGHVNQG
jgi:hypothetical protein